MTVAAQALEVLHIILIKTDRSARQFEATSLGALNVLIAALEQILDGNSRLRSYSVDGDTRTLPSFFAFA